MTNAASPDSPITSVSGTLVTMDSWLEAVAKIDNQK